MKEVQAKSDLSLEQIDLWQRKRFFESANQKSEPVPTLEMSRAQMASLIADWTVA